MTLTAEDIGRPRSAALDALSCYWPENAAPVRNLPFASSDNRPHSEQQSRMTTVALPNWGAQAGVEGGLLVPQSCITQGDGRAWQRTDWPSAVSWYLDGIAERAHERVHGPIHSFSYKLHGWDERIWQRAWVNRIGLFLRLWAAQTEGCNADSLLGPLPNPRIHLTHDLDAIRKTFAIRTKQAAFQSFNTARMLLRGRTRDSLARLLAAARFLLSGSEYNRLHEIAAAEERHGVRSHFLVYGGRGGWMRRPDRILFDPSYSVHDHRIASILCELGSQGWEVGLHQSFHAWSTPDPMLFEKKRVERAVGRQVKTCRQHWLRFSWESTWLAQQQADLALDLTLGFNDRPGFRNGAALRHHPWDTSKERALVIESIPLVLMDSHLFDYQMLDQNDRIAQISSLLEEVRSVSGEASILWHPHTLSPDYGWGHEYEYILNLCSDIAS